jgi:Flp pilus assembly pilin Flp
MPRNPFRHVTLRVRRLARRWQADRSGIAAIEFALIVPIMAVMFIGAVELSQAITVDRRVTQVASSTADLIARWEKPTSPTAPNGIQQSEVTDIMKVGGYIVEPFSKNPLQIVIRSVMSSPTNASVTKQWWSCTYKGVGDALTCACSNTTYNLPANLVTKGDSVILAETTYDYKPLVFDYFMKKSYGSSGGTGTYTLAETIYLKPRNSSVNYVLSNNTTCPSPTF